MDYPVIEPLRHDGERYAPGDTAPAAAFTKAQVAHLQRRGVLGGEPSSTGADDAPDQALQALVAAIDQLDPTNEQHFTNGGKPECAALAAAAGRESVSAKARDAAWAVYQEGRQ